MDTSKRKRNYPSLINILDDIAPDEKFEKNSKKKIAITQRKNHIANIITYNKISLTHRQKKYKFIKSFLYSNSNLTNASNRLNSKSNDKKLFLLKKNDVNNINIVNTKKPEEEAILPKTPLNIFRKTVGISEMKSTYRNKRFNDDFNIKDLKNLDSKIDFKISNLLRRIKFKENNNKNIKDYDSVMKDLKSNYLKDINIFKNKNEKFTNNRYFLNNTTYYKNYNKMSTSNSIHFNEKYCTKKVSPFIFNNETIKQYIFTKLFYK